jgi:hypothetical protein
LGTAARAPEIDCSGVSAGNATEICWRARSAASVSTGAPTDASAVLEIDAQPSCGLKIWLMVPASATIAPGCWAVTVIVTEPPLGIVIGDGRFHRLPLVSRATPPVITVPALPMTRHAAVDWDATLRDMPLIRTSEESSAPCAKLGA